MEATRKMPLLKAQVNNWINTGELQAMHGFQHQSSRKVPEGDSKPSGVTSYQSTCSDNNIVLVALCVKTDWAEAHMGHDPKSIKHNQFGAMGGQIWGFGGEN
eukprot:838893-Pelagomonas_calceolata.AAC.3